VIARAGKMCLSRQFSQELGGCGLQVAGPTALLQDGDSLGWQCRGDGSNLVGYSVGISA
jgi:hypothetical protein